MKMTIRTRLIVQFTLIVTSFLIVFSLIIYFFFAHYRESDFYNRLKKKGLTTAKLLIETKEVDRDLLKIIDRNTINALYQEKVMIFDYHDRMIYNSLDDDSVHVSKALLYSIRNKKEIRYQEGRYEVIGMLYVNNDNRFIVISLAYDRYGRHILGYLRYILITSIFVSIGATIFIGNIYAKRFLRHISDVVKQVDKITVYNLNTRLNEGNGTDEIAKLAIKFNQMLERLESAFEMQKNFVSIASHEFRTPLTSITGQIEVALMRSRTLREYKTVLESIHEDIKNLNALSNGLLNLAMANAEANFMSFHPLRIDEILWGTRNDLLRQKNEYNISIQFDESVEDGNKFLVSGNEQLLKTVIGNLIDNACKYSPDHLVNIMLSADDQYSLITFSDHGIGIDHETLENIYQPFVRGKNAKITNGSGLGLPLVERIIRLHHGEISIESLLEKGTTVTIRIPFCV